MMAITWVAIDPSSHRPCIASGFLQEAMLLEEEEADVMRQEQLEQKQRQEREQEELHDLSGGAVGNTELLHPLQEGSGAAPPMHGPGSAPPMHQGPGGMHEAADVVAASMQLDRCIRPVTGHMLLSPRGMQAAPELVASPMYQGQCIRPVTGHMLVAADVLAALAMLLGMLVCFAWEDYALKPGFASGV